jgi:hypothetical protein
LRTGECTGNVQNIDGDLTCVSGMGTAYGSSTPPANPTQRPH